MFTVERYRTLAEGARKALAELGYDNVTVIAGDGLNGVPEHAPYDRIIVTAAAETIPQKLVEELAEGGVMVLPLGEHDGPQRIVKLTRGEDGVDAAGADLGAFRAAFARAGARIVGFSRTD